jgi:Acetyltransferase (GNAT) domain
MSNAPATDASTDEHETLRLLDPVEDPEWDAFVRTQPAAQIFHRAAWLALLRDQYGFRTLAACAVSNKTITAGIPICELRHPWRGRRWISLPFSDRCGPLGQQQATVERLMSWTVLQAGAARATFEVRDQLPQSVGMSAHVGHWLHVTPLSGSRDELLARLHPDVRRSIRKGLASGLTTEVRSDPDALDEFYRLHLLTRRKQGVPIQPQRYFNLFQRMILNQGLGFVTLTREGARVLSAGVFCQDNGTTLYKYGASDPAASSLPATYLMCWASMVHALESGSQVYDFGKTATSNEGLRFFKNKWATQESRLPYFYSPLAPSSAEPGFMLTHVVQPIIRNSPVAVCRLAGEALYKHFAA